MQPSRRQRTTLTAWGLTVLFLVPFTAGLGQEAAPIGTDELQALRPRLIGPAVTGGRIHDIEAVPGNPSTLYVASASGGLWRSYNRGQTWVNVFDTMAVSTFGDVALAPSDPRILYAGTGEQNNRQSTSWGNGVYRSEDGGDTWRHLGLASTRHIGKIEIHPSNPDIAYVAALGNLWTASPERGLYRTRDGGQTWERVLHVDEHTGIVDLVMDPSNPDVLYAATYQRLRRTWGFNGGGPGSGIYKSTDGGETWRELTSGIPEGDKGRIGLALASSNPRVLNALIEHANRPGTYRSEDGGESWQRVNTLNPRPMYYSEIFIDPSNEDRVYVLGTSSFRSEDGGRTFQDISARPTYDVGVHADHHALWIDPDDPSHFFLGGDAGLHETYDGGRNYQRINNFVIGQFYALGLDMRDPYWVYGGMQDNHSWMGPSRTRHWIGILGDDWRQIGFGDGMYWQIDPTSHRYAYGNAQNGSYTRVDPETGDALDIRPYPPEGEEDYRWDWASPSLISGHDPNVVYVGGNRLFISRDRGVTWERTQDLTRQIDRDTLELMGVRGTDITLSRNDGTSSYGEITTIAESPLDASVLWVGTDDGNLQVSRDGGTSWSEVSRNIQGSPRGTYVSRVVASRADPGTAYVTLDAHRDGDFAPYVFRTEDFGRSWRSLTGDLPSGSVSVILEHPDASNVLFLGTEHHLFASTDAGETWSRMPGLPTTAYDDLVIHPREKDLVVGTHGRGIWIVDDTRPLAEWNAEIADARAHLFSIRPGTILHYWKDTSYRGQAEFHGENPPDGALITYLLGPGGEDATLTITGPSGALVRTMEVPGAQGLHRVNWDLRHGLAGEDPAWAPQDTGVLPRPTERRGPLVSPGTYTVTLESRGIRMARTVEVRSDPDSPATLAQQREREAFLLTLLSLEREIEESTSRITSLRESGQRGAQELRDVEQELRRHLAVANGIYDSLNGSGVRQGTLYPPTETHRQRVAEIETGLAQVERVLREG